MNLICSQLFEDQVGLKFEYGIFEEIEIALFELFLDFSTKFYFTSVFALKSLTYIYFIFGFS